MPGSPEETVTPYFCFGAAYEEMITAWRSGQWEEVRLEAVHYLDDTTELLGRVNGSGAFFAWNFFDL